ncbi:Outer membrane protein TolC precursor [Sporomusa ovata DSM 2662]|uniref:Outer membrane protein n=1 Tax=Sporomusa ovata TaxID=2378 RepID=A0A0U1KT47_9FIRM|nr:TolC family protein [Sporomusa ovata]EQB26515.1 outer membrane protein [Sporomusa ovata DSM 2662]CQR70602.1 Outer membrane protein [Sporomusa ovata]
MVKFILSSRKVKQVSALLTGTMLMAVSLPGFAAPVELTLDEAVAMALKSNPSVKISESELEKANWDVSVAKAGKAPSVSLSHNASRYKTAASGAYVYNYNSPTDRPYKVPVPDYLTTLYANSIDLTLPLYTGGKLEGTIDKAKLAVKVADLGIAEAQQQIKLDATNGYYSILQTRNLVTLRGESLDRLAEHLKNVEAQYNAGTVAKTDVLRSEVEKADAEQNLIIAKNSYELAVSSLNNIISLPLDTELIVKDELKYQKFDKTLEDCIKVALTNRPSLAQAQVNVDIAKTSIKVAESGNKLTVAATASEKWHDSDFPGTENNTWSIGINASYNLFDGGLVRAQVKGSKAELTKATEQLRQIKDSVQLEVRQAYLNMLEAEKRIETSKVAVVKGEEDYKIAQVRYSAGVGTNLDVIDSQVALTSAKTDYVQALYDYNTSRAKLNKAMGIAVN